MQKYPRVALLEQFKATTPQPLTTVTTFVIHDFCPYAPPPRDLLAHQFAEKQEAERRAKEEEEERLRLEAEAAAEELRKRPVSKTEQVNTLLIGKLAERLELCNDLLVLLRRAQEKASVCMCVYCYCCRSTVDALKRCNIICTTGGHPLSSAVVRRNVFRIMKRSVLNLPPVTHPKSVVYCLVREQPDKSGHASDAIHAHHVCEMKGHALPSLSMAIHKEEEYFTKRV